MAPSTACTPSLSRGSLRRQSSTIRTGCANERPSGSARGVPREWYPYRDPTRFSCMKFLGVPWGLRLRRTDQRFTLSPLFILPAAACQVPIGGVGGLFSWSLFAEAWLLRNSIFQKSEKISGIENV